MKLMRIRVLSLEVRGYVTSAVVFAASRRRTLEQPEARIHLVVRVPTVIGERAGQVRARIRATAFRYLRENG